MMVTCSDGFSQELYCNEDVASGVCGNERSGQTVSPEDRKGASSSQSNCNRMGIDTYGDFHDMTKRRELSDDYTSAYSIRGSTIETFLGDKFRNISREIALNWMFMAGKRIGMELDLIHRAIKLLYRYCQGTSCDKGQISSKSSSHKSIDSGFVYRLHIMALVCLSLVFRVDRGCYNVEAHIARRSENVDKSHVFPLKLLQFDCLYSIDYGSVLRLETFMLQKVFRWRIHDISPFQYIASLVDDVKRTCNPCEENKKSSCHDVSHVLKRARRRRCILEKAHDDAQTLVRLAIIHNPLIETLPSPFTAGIALELALRRTIENECNCDDMMNEIIPRLQAFMKDGNRAKLCEYRNEINRQQQSLMYIMQKHM